MANQLTIAGTFLGANETKFVGKDGTFAVRPFWIDITDNAQYPNTPEFQLKGDKVNLVDNLRKGQTIEVSFNIDGRKYDKTNEGGKKGVITNLVAWRIKVISMQSAATVGHGPAVTPGGTAMPSVPSVRSAAAPLPFTGTEGGDDDLPF